MEQPRFEFLNRESRPDMIEALRAYATRRLSFATRRFEGRIRNVMVRLADLNGRKRGVDSRCSISVDLIDGRHLFVHATTPWPFASLTKAASRLNSVLRREFDRSAWQRNNDPETA